MSYYNGNACRCLYLIYVPGETENEKSSETQYYDRRRDRQKLERNAARLRWRVDLRFIDDYEWRLIEVATFVGFRIDEEALGAAFHIGFGNS